MKIPFKPVTVRSGDLRTPVTFYDLPANKYEPGDFVKPKKVYETYAQVYAPSQKDITMLNNGDASTGVTIKIRNTRGEFTPNHTQRVYIEDYRYSDYLWNVKDVRPDFKNEQFDVLVLNNPIERGDLI